MAGRTPPATVRGVMTTPVITINLESTIREAAELMNEKGVGSIVITHRGKPIGIVTERDMVQRVLAVGLEAQKKRIEAITSKPLITAKPDTPIVDAIRKMHIKKIRRLVIIENKKLVGIVTQRDLLRTLALHVIISFRPLLEQTWK